MDFKEKRAIVNSAFCSGIASVMPSATVPDWLKLTHNPEVFAHFKTSIKIFIAIRRNISDYVRYVIRNVCAQILNFLNPPESPEDVQIRIDEIDSLKNFFKKQ